MEILESPDRVDWARPHHAYAPAADVPAQLRALSGPEIAVKEFPVPWDRSLLGFAALALDRLGLSW